MKDAFALFGFERRPALDSDDLQECYLQKAALLHPDRPEGDAQAFVELGIARSLLADPAKRLRHLVDLEGGTTIRPPLERASEIMDATTILLRANQQISEIQAALTPLAKALATQSARQPERKLEQIQKDMEVILSGLQQKILAADRIWPDIPLAELAEIAFSFQFVQKKKQQISETLFQLRSVLGMV